MLYCFDLDGTLCTQQPDGLYENARPYPERIAKVNKLFAEGHAILIDTARGSVTGRDWKELTEKQLQKWGVDYHELRVGKKSYAEKYIDDRAVNAKDFFG